MDFVRVAEVEARADGRRNSMHMMLMGSVLLAALSLSQGAQAAPWCANYGGGGTGGGGGSNCGFYSFDQLHGRALGKRWILRAQSLRELIFGRTGFAQTLPPRLRVRSTLWTGLYKELMGLIASSTVGLGDPSYRRKECLVSGAKEVLV
jgi:hypothetical protein